jgi:uncharacterized membrane protein YfcA
MTIGLYGILTLIVMLGALVQGAIGFGLGLVAVPLLLHVEPRCVPGPLLFATVWLTILLTHREWRSIRLADLKWALGGRVAGILVALLVLAAVPSDRLALLLGALVLVAVVLSATSLRLRASPASLVGAGVASGFMGTTVAIGGPPMALLYQRESGPRIRGTLSAFFVVGISLSLVALHFDGRFGRPDLILGAELTPGVLLGYALSIPLARVLDRGYMRAAVLAVSAATALGAVIRQL